MIVYDLTWIIEKEWMKTSIKLKINQRVGAGLLESEFDWLSRILTEDTLVIVITDWLLKVCMTINVHIDLSVQFLQVPFSKVDSVKGEVVRPLSMNPLLKQTGPACFKLPLCSCSGSFKRILVGIYENKSCTVGKSSTLYCNGVWLEHKGALVFEKILSTN